MSEELKPCPRCRKDVSVIHAHGCKFIRCDCGIQSSRYGEHIADWRMAVDWNYRPVEDSQAVRIAELEKMAEARKLANRLLEHERNELKAERDQLREALEKIAQWDMLARSQKGLIAIIDVLKDAARKALEGVENVEKDS